MLKCYRRGMGEYDVMTLAGHANFETTRTFYLAIDGDGLLDRARQASSQALSQNLLRSCCAPPKMPHNEKRPTNLSACQPELYANG